METSTNKAYLQLHVAVFLFGFTAILGELISLKELPLVWHRMWMTAASFLFLPRVIRAVRQYSIKQVLQFAGVGCIVAMHWITFYGSIKYSNVSVALSCLATASFFTSFIEPLVFKAKIKGAEVLMGLLVILGIYLIYTVTQFYLTGIILGVLSALLAATFSTLNKKILGNNDTLSVTFIELGSGWLFLTLSMPLYFYLFPETTMTPSSSDWGYLLILALICTSLAYVLALNALKVLTAFTSNLAINLEPVYGIIMAAIIFNENEELDNRFYYGTAVILLSVTGHSLVTGLQRRKKRRKEKATEVIQN